MKMLKVTVDSMIFAAITFFSCRFLLSVSFAEEVSSTPGSLEEWSSLNPPGPCARRAELKNNSQLAELMAFWNKILRAELLSLSQDLNFIFPIEDRDVIDIEHRVCAKAVAEMLMSLHTMQRTDEILMYASQGAVQDNLKVVDCKRDGHGGVFLHSWFVKINESMYGEPSLKDEFDFRREEAARVTTPCNRDASYFNNSAILPRAFDEYFEAYLNGSSPVFTFESRGISIERVGYVNRVFMNVVADVRCCGKNSSDEEYKRHLLANAMVELAKEKTFEKRATLNKIYSFALRVQEWAGQNEDLVKTELFAALKTLLEEETELSAKLDRKMIELEIRDLYMEFAKNHMPV